MSCIQYVSMDVRNPLYSGCLTDSSIESYTACWQQPLKHPVSGYVLQGLNGNSNSSLWNSGSMDCCVCVTESWHDGGVFWLHLLSSIKFTQANSEADERKVVPCYIREQCFSPLSVLMRLDTVPTEVSGLLLGWLPQYGANEHNKNKQERMSNSKVNRNLCNKIISLFQVDRRQNSFTIHVINSFHKQGKTQNTSQTQKPFFFSILLFPLEKNLCANTYTRTFKVYNHLYRQLLDF